ncbi:tetratricopeptide repeat-containing sulfotransferase family protein [Phenylobacterium sp.]|uniref:tetratricopeptide repeat-containing sulfotransferase family protein n=1 Tax=Phenylobacterium sp. TaxID=1871053 RepID=UPI002E3128C2|nr:sulfotransferase [Phenylobacterium sp.]HEX3367135.1 sulfotransferase [Phenylobacterium sp.]
MRGLDEAAAHFRAGRLDAAAQVYRRLERQAPDDVRPGYSLAVIDINQGRLERARDRLVAVVAREPRMAAAQHNLGAVSQSLGEWSSAAEAYARALDLNPAAGESRVGLAMALAALGRSAEAVKQNRALAVDPTHRWPALTRIALIDAGEIGDDDLAAMQAAASDEATPAAQRVGLWFALGEALERRARDADAFEAYAQGNRLQRAALDVAAAARANAQAAAYVTEMVTPKFVAEHVGQGGQSAAPIFVVGMPRSGSTLIEQILASHPLVQAFGETGLLPRLLERGYPKTAAGLRETAARYLGGLRARGWDGSSRVVDKTLENYLHAGLIGVLFPRAVILHVVRDPVDNGFACYRQLFAEGNETLYDLADIGAEYLRYRGLMETWSARLPGRIVEVGYEALVTDPETQARRLLAEAGLAWDPAVLRFHERQAAVQTASASQVRRPIYATSAGRWRRHAERLQPLIAALGFTPDSKGNGANDGT